MVYRTITIALYFNLFFMSKEKFPSAEHGKTKESIPDQNTPEENDRLKAKIENAASLGDIVQSFITAKGIMGSDQFYSKEKVAQSLLFRAWLGKFKETDITRNLGLRDKVNELLKDQKPFMESTKETWEEIERKVGETKNIGMLLRVLYEYAGIFTPRNKTYSALDIANSITYARGHKEEGDVRFDMITSAFGIRKKAREFVKELEAKEK